MYFIGIFLFSGGSVCVCVWGGGAHYIRMGSRDEQTKVVLFSLIGSGGDTFRSEKGFMCLESGGGGGGG